MGTILYKRLFEVRILHDYFLSSPDTTSIYALNENDRITFLNDRIASGQYGIWNYFDLVIPDRTAELMKNYHVRLVKMPAGFLVGIKVKPLLNTAGEEEYLPFVPLSDQLRPAFSLKMKNPELAGLTNLRINNPVQAQYYFSNSNEDGNKIFPSLSLPVNSFQTGRTYETGELALLGGSLREAREETSNPAPGFWQPMEGSGLANEQDRMMLPKVFSYRFPSPVNTAEFSLKKDDGSVVKSVFSNGAGSFGQINLDFRQTTPEAGELPALIIDDFYQLEISSDTFNETINIYLSDDLYQSANIATIVIETNVSDPDFKVLNDDGTLVTKKKVDGSMVPHPVFEIRFKRRSTYWRFRSNSGATLKATAKTAPFLNEEDGHLVTKELRPLSYYATRFEDPAAPADPGFHLPSPGTGSVSRVQKKLFSDIFVSPIKGLINLE